MYKPIAENDNKQLSAFYNGFRKSMSKAVNIMLYVAILISAIYPLLIRKSDIKYLTVFSIFLLLSLKVILPYKITMVPKYMIIAKEQKYKAELIGGLTRGITYITEIVLLTVIINFNFVISVQVVLLVSVIISLIDGILFHIVIRAYLW